MGAREMERREAGQPISLEPQLADPLPQVQVPIGQLTEVFRNLLDNAYRAMQDKGRKTHCFQLPN